MLRLISVPALKRTVERIVWTASLLCLTVWGGLHLLGTSSARTELSRFTAAKEAAAADPTSPDLSLWSTVRIKAWEDARLRQAPAALAVLRIPKIRLEVPVLEGTDDWTLNRAVGHIEDTAAPGANGNVGIAGHRDGFFRGLKDVGVGDALDLETLTGTQHYLIERIWIVSPEDVDVIGPTPTRAVTLVTCYPFYFVGSAPQRYIVRAVPSPALEASTGGELRPNLRDPARTVASPGPGSPWHDPQ